MRPRLCACLDLRRLSLMHRGQPAHIRAGVAAGRLELRLSPSPHGRPILAAHRVHRRLAFRSMPGRGNGAASLLTLRHPDLGTVRLPYA